MLTKYSEQTNCNLVVTDYISGQDITTMKNYDIIKNSEFEKGTFKFNSLSQGDVDELKGIAKKLDYLLEHPKEIVKSALLRSALSIAVIAGGILGTALLAPISMPAALGVAAIAFLISGTLAAYSVAKTLSSHTTNFGEMEMKGILGSFIFGPLFGPLSPLFEIMQLKSNFKQSFDIENKNIQEKYKQNVDFFNGNYKKINKRLDKKITTMDLNSDEKKELTELKNKLENLKQYYQLETNA